MGILVFAIVVGIAVAIGGFFLLARSVDNDAEYQRQLRANATKSSTFENRTKPGPYKAPGELLEIKPPDQP